jgi:hypothetical protein
MAKGGNMKQTLFTVAAAFSLIFAGLAFAVEGMQPSEGKAPTFEQMKAHQLKRLDDMINSLQKGKACSEAAKNQEDLRACRPKHKTEKKNHRGEMRKRGGPEVQVPTEVN